MKKLLIASFASIALTGCPFDGDNNSSNDGTDTGSVSDPTPTATPSPDPAATPAPTASPAPTSSPSPTPTPTAGSGAASACFNPVLSQQGTQTELSYRSTDGDSGEVLTFTDDRMVTGPATFNGAQTIRTDGTTTSSSSAGNYTTQTETYSNVDNNALLVTAHGVITTTTIQGFTTTTEGTFDPPSRMRFDLDVNQSFTQNYQVTTSTDTGFGTFDSLSDVEETITYRGQESVTVPGGTFDTCRFDSTVVTTVDGQTGTENVSNWFSVGSGVLIKNEAGNDMSEFTGGTVNGAAVR